MDASGLDTLLAKEEVTLREVLDEEDVLQECKTQNSKLIEFLIRDDVLTELLHLVVDDPDEGTNEQVKYKYANQACEVLTSDIITILDKIANDRELLCILWSILLKPAPLNSLLASFFAKVLTMLLCRKGNEIYEFLKSNDAVNTLLVHIEISAIMECFIKMVTVVESQELRLEISRWLDSEELIRKLILLLASSNSEEKHYCSGQLLSELVRIGRDCISQYVECEDDPLLVTLERSETIQLLLDTVMLDIRDSTAEQSHSSVTNGVAVLLSMIEMKRPTIEGLEEMVAPMDADRIALGVFTTLEVLSTRLGDIYNIMLTPPLQESMLTTVGILDPPLGQVRLSIASLIANAISTNASIISEQLVKTDTINLFLELFIRYEWNNFLHAYVHQTVNGILCSELTDCPGEENKENPLLENLFRQCNIIEKVIQGWEFNRVEECKPGGYRKGYMGHLTKIANAVVNNMDNGPNCNTIKNLFNELPGELRESWLNLVNGPLDEANQKNQCVSVSLLPHGFDSTSDSEDCIPINISQYQGTLQNAYENYQVQAMTNEFVENFGYDEETLQDNDMIRNPFEEVGNINFIINANVESQNEQLFEQVCKHKITPFDDDSSEEEDVWEEKQIEFSANVNTTIEISKPSAANDSDDSVSPPSSDDEETLPIHKENKSTVQVQAFPSNRNASLIASKTEPFGKHNVFKVKSDPFKMKSDPFKTKSDPFKTKSDPFEPKCDLFEMKEEKMDIDSEWTATFDGEGMDTTGDVSAADEWSQIVAKAAMSATPPPSTSVSLEDFTDFTDLSKIEGFDPHESSSAMEEEQTNTKPPSPYEVQMEDVDVTIVRNVIGGDDNVSHKKMEGSTNQAETIEIAETTTATSPRADMKLPKVSMAKRVTSITVKSVRSPTKEHHPASLEDVFTDTTDKTDECSSVVVHRNGNGSDTEEPVFLAHDGSIIDTAQSKDDSDKTQSESAGKIPQDLNLDKSDRMDETLTIDVIAGLVSSNIEPMETKPTCITLITDVSNAVPEMNGPIITEQPVAIVSET